MNPWEVHCASVQREESRYTLELVSKALNDLLHMQYYEAGVDGADAEIKAITRTLRQKIQGAQEALHEANVNMLNREMVSWQKSQLTKQ